MPRGRQFDHPVVAFKKSKIHGTGGFARIDLRRSKRIIEYVGPKLSKTESQAKLDAGNAYIFILNEEEDIDGSVRWNLARFLNHSCDPNCEAGIVRGRIWLYARRAIKAGDELTYNYGHELEGYEDRSCRCGASTSVGYRVGENHFDTVRQRHLA